MTISKFNMSTLVATDYGKNICWSIPYHDLKLIPEMDRRASLKNQSRSQYLRSLVREDISKGYKEVGRRWSVTR